MNSTHKTFPHRKPVPLAAVLPCLLGIGLLVLYFKFAFFLKDLPELGRQGIFFMGTLQLMWGLQQVVSHYFFSKGEGSKRLFGNHRVMLPREGGLYLVIMGVFLVGALLGKKESMNMLLLVFSLMVGPFIINGWITYSMLQRNEVKRTLPDRAMVGEIVPVGITLQNNKRVLSSWLMTVHDLMENGAEQLTTGVVFARVPGRNSRSGEYQFRPMRRGVYRFGPIDLTSRFPFGLVERGLLMDNRDELKVYPRIGKLTSRWHQQLPTAAELVDQNPLQRGAYDDEFHRLREFRAGDNPRAIHWRSSARQSELMVREYQQTRDQDLALILDLWRPETSATLADLERVELAISFAATIALEHLRKKRTAHLVLGVSGKEQTRWDTQEAGATWESLLDTFTLLEPGVSTQTPELVEEFSQTVSSRTRLILITTRTEPQQAMNGLKKLRQEIQDRNQSVVPLEVITADRDELTPYFYMD